MMLGDCDCFHGNYRTCADCCKMENDEMIERWLGRDYVDLMSYQEAFSLALHCQSLVDNGDKRDYTVILAECL